MSRPPDLRAKRALERAEADPEFEGALRAAYRGRHDVFDALWWAAHPMTTSPRGVADPATSLRELQRAVFSRAAAESPLVEEPDPDTGRPIALREGERRLRQAQRLLTDDARDLATALAAVGLDQAPVAQARPQVQDEREPERLLAARKVPASIVVRPRAAEQEPPNATEVEQHHTAPAGATPRRKILLPALAGMGLLSIILLLPTLSELDPGADGEPSPGLTTAPRIKTEIVTLSSAGNVTDPLALLERPQVETDRPPAGFPTSIPAESFRALPDLVGHVRLFLTRGEDPDFVCLVAVQPDNLGMSGCMPEADFLESGMHLGGGRYPVDDYMTILTESYSLLPSGEFRYDATARVRERDTTHTQH